MSLKKTGAFYCIAAGLFALAASISYFANRLVKINENLPTILQEVQLTQDKFDPLLSEVTEIRLLIPDVLTQIDSLQTQIPLIIESISSIQQAIPDSIKEVEKITAQMPALLEEVTAIRTQTIPLLLDEVSALRTETIPNLLQETEKFRSATIPSILSESSEIRTLVPGIIHEVEQVRTDIPVYLDRADELTENMRTVGREASEGAVAGIFTGIIKSPLSFFPGLRRNTEEPPEEKASDFETARSLTQELVKGKDGDSRDWQNLADNHHGTITRVSTTAAGVITLDLKIWDTDEKMLEHNEYTIRQLDDSSWELVELIEH